MLTIDIVPESGLDAVRAFYAAAGYGGGAAPRDLTLAAHMDARLAGVVRLCPEEGTIVLRGMQVAQECRRHGIGQALLAHCAPHLDRGMAYCLPYDHLTGFYGRAGFAVIGPETLPPFLAQRLATYLSQGQRVLAMRRLPRPLTP